MQTFLWHDYETWGVNPVYDRPCQFAAIRTDENLNPVGEPVMIYAKPGSDYLPHPQAALVTGISPQHADANGVCEAAFISQIHDLMMQPQTCSVGYNSLRFDDEVTRHTLYRNLHDAYEREYKNGNSRWDLIDVVRLCAVTRPDGINWPTDENGLPSFRLEALTAANGIEQQGAHDALVDVRATIDVARLIRDKQPKLFEYALSMRDKMTVSQLLSVGSFKPIFHISGMFGSANACASVVVPIAMHPTNKNEVICFDLREDPTPFMTLDAETLRERLFSSNADLQALAEQVGVESLARFPIKNIHINKCPMVAGVGLLKDESVCRRANLDPAQIMQNLQRVRNWGELPALLKQLYVGRTFETPSDPDAMLYGGGFFSYNDKNQLAQLRALPPEELAEQSSVFDDARLPEMVFRYRARNYPQTLSADERAQWQEYCAAVLDKPGTDKRLSYDVFDSALAEAADTEQGAAQRALLDALAAWRQQLQHTNSVLDEPIQ
ncbi:Exodeoxyribonuclease I [BD1-7 clade bacterium]|uniref:Exodeoxyribonuclease I n=1 Tax=BD1-7 clade bacterium TaxID=2029982 RepID=A0A5S9QZ50_9GAMM|nr:Exodeoxyribonuclease I [BD1-7 clade bacterium]